MRITTRGGVSVWDAASDPFDIVGANGLSEAFDDVTNQMVIRRSGLLANRGAASANEGSLYVVTGEVAPNTARNGFIYYSDGASWLTERDPSAGPLEKWGVDTSHPDVLTPNTSGTFFILTTITVPTPCRVFCEADTYASITGAGGNWARNFRINGTLVAQPTGQVVTSGWQRSQGVIDLPAGTFTVEGRNEQGAGGGGGVTTGTSQWRVRVAGILA